MSEVKAEILDEEITIEDSLVNLAASLGTSKDKRSNSTFTSKNDISKSGCREELEALYTENWLAGKVVDIIPEDMTREWRMFNGDIDPKVIDQLEKEEERLSLRKMFERAHRFGRLYGTAYIVMSVDDGQTPDMPLDINAIKPGGLRHIQVVDRHRVNRDSAEPTQNPLDKNFGMPEYYRFNETSVVIHHSRVLRFDGQEIPYKLFRDNNYNSNSVIQRLYDSITNFDTVVDSCASIVYESNIDVFKIKNFMNQIANPKQRELMVQRFTLASSMKSFNNALLLDMEEDYDIKNKTFSGLPDLIDRYAQILSAASDIPATRLLGVSASGFNATGEGDLKNYYDKIKSDQVSTYKPLLDYFDTIMAKSLGLSEDADLSYIFNSLFQMTPKEEADVEFVEAQRDAIYLDRGVVTEAAVAKQLKEKDTYTNIEDEDIKDLEDLGDLGDGDNAFGNNPIGSNEENQEEGEEGREGQSA